jgi:predicted S18 family serine protease
MLENVEVEDPEERRFSHSPPKNFANELEQFEEDFKGLTNSTLDVPDTKCHQFVSSVVSDSNHVIYSEDYPTANCSMTEEYGMKLHEGTEVNVEETDDFPEQSMRQKPVEE